MALKFDEMTVDTSLAQEYLKNDEDLFLLYNNYDTQEKFTFFINGKMCKMYQSGLLIDTKQPGRRHLRHLAVLLKQNAKLFAQLEYLNRNIPIEDTNVQLDLIIRWLQCLILPGVKVGFGEIPFCSDNSLLRLASAVIKSFEYIRTDMYVDKQTAFVSYLFSKLCYEAGLLNILVRFGGQCPDLENSLNCYTKLESGTVAVVSEDADIDSAVDTLLASSTQVPWRLRRILVQESVYQVFKDALNWKCNLNKKEKEAAEPIELCAEYHIYNDRVFLIDCMETLKQKTAVTVEAYRTTKEVLSILKKEPNQYLSLWSNDVAEINEVSYSTSSPVVWVNNLGEFRGPPNITQAIFDDMYPTFLISKTEKVSKLIELSQSWLKLDLDARREILYDVLDKCNSAISLDQSIYTDIYNSLSDCTVKSFVDVGNNYVCVGITKPRGIIYTTENFFTVKHFQSIVYGNAFLMRVSNMDAVVFDILKNAGVPVINISNVQTDSGDIKMSVLEQNIPTYTRTIWTNSGTIFAN